MTKKKTRNLFLGIFGTLALAVGFGSVINSQRNAVQTDAIAIPASTALYLKPNSLWLQAGARFAAYFFTDSPVANEWVDFVKEAGVLDIYKVVAPTTAYEKVIFARMNPDAPDNIWGNKWNQTGNLVYDGTNNLLTLPANVWNDSITVWSVYDPADHPLPPTFAADLPLYFKNSGEFMTGATNMAAYYFIDGGADTDWVAMTQVDIGIYEAITPTLVGKEYDRVIFVSLSEATLDWTKKVQQTADLVHETGKHLYDNATTSWVVYTAREEVTLTDTVAGIKADKVRIWLDRSGHYEDGYSFTLKVDSTRYKPTGFQKALMLYTKDATPVQYDRYFVYYDLPASALEGKSVGVSIVSTPYNKLYVEVPAVAYTAGDNNKVWKINLASEVWSISKGAIVNRIYNTFFAKVLEGYLSCSTSEVNGYMAFDDLDANFLPKTGEVWNMEGDLGGNMIDDYANQGQANYTTGTRGNSVDAYAKYLQMQNFYTAWLHPTQNIGYFENNNAIALIIGIALVGLTSIAGLYVLKKKRA